MISRTSSPTASSSPRPDHDAAPELSSSSPGSNTDARPTSQDSSILGAADASSQSFELQERHPKGKRKRTAAKDKAILEASYNANPKPDKAARLDIVKRVSLNEKEVQIWFQNRRQNDRRKSRPLSPQEIAALRCGGMQIISSDPVVYGSVTNGLLNSDPSNPPSDAQHTSPIQNMTHPEPPIASPISPTMMGHVSSDETEQPREHPHPTEPRVEGLDTVDRPQAPMPETATPSQQPAAPTHEGSFGLSQSFSSSIGYLANRWNAASSFSTPSTLGRRGEDSFKLESFAPSSCSSAASAPILPPPTASQSSFRLSLSLEGKAEVVSSNTSPPHLPAPRPSAETLQALGQPRPLNLNRSQSASPVITLPPISTLTSSLPSTSTAATGPGASAGALPPRLTRGRSRDVHAWEFCCDVEGREDELLAQAKHESNGSAIAAISLLRSTSASSSATPSPTAHHALQPSSSAKRNATTTRAAPRPGGAKKPKLGRALSSVGRMQSAGGSFFSGLGVGLGIGLGNVQEKKQQQQKAIAEGRDKVKVSMLVSPSGNDSDKENWSPDEDGNPIRHNHHFLPSASNAGAGRKPLPHVSAGGNANPRRTLGRVLLDEVGPRFGAGRSNTVPFSGRGHHRDGKRGGSPLEIFEDGGRGEECEDCGEDEDCECGRHRKRPRDSGVVVDEEVERFMRGEVSPSKKGDVDAVAGLLSLSQGNWR